MPIETLDLTGMDIDTFAWRGEVLRTRMAIGYARKVVGETAGLHKWTLSSGCLPDAEAYGNLIEGVPRFKYYWDFFAARMAAGDEPFILEFRGKNYHASFAESEISAEMFTIDLFAAGVTIRQRQLRGVAYDEDGAIVPPSALLYGGDTLVYGGDSLVFSG